LARFGRQEPVLARPVSRLERGWRWCKRNPLVASLLSLVFLLMGLGTGVAWLLAARPESEASEARHQFGLAEQARAKADEKTKEAMRLQGEAEQARENEKKETIAARAAERLERRRNHGVGMLLTQAAWEQNQVDR